MKLNTIVLIGSLLFAALIVVDLFWGLEELGSPLTLSQIGFFAALIYAFIHHLKGEWGPMAFGLVFACIFIDTEFEERRAAEVDARFDRIELQLKEKNDGA